MALKSPSCPLDEARTLQPLGHSTSFRTGLRVQGFRLRVQGFWLRVFSLGTVWGFGFRDTVSLRASSSRKVEDFGDLETGV